MTKIIDYENELNEEGYKTGQNCISKIDDDILFIRIRLRSKSKLPRRCPEGAPCA